MTDLIQILSNLHRPRLLIRAARFGITDYNRKRDLRRLLNASSQMSASSAVTALMAKEAGIEENRKNGEASYSVARHVEVLIALIAEARILQSGPRAV